MKDERSRARCGRAGCWMMVAFLSVAGAGGGRLRVVAWGGTALAAAAPPALLSEDDVRGAIDFRLERMQARRDQRQRQRHGNDPGVPGGAINAPVIPRVPPPLPPELLDGVDR